MSTKSKSGQSIIEIIVAVSILIIIAATSVSAILGSFSTTRLAEEETQAALIAVEGLEAVQSIRNQDWSNLATGTYGLSNSGSLWSFSGSSDTDSSNKFTRTITISDIQRDFINSGDIVDSDGTLDLETKKITSTVVWDFTSARQNTVEMTSLLTHWQLSRKYGGISAGPQPNIGSEDCFIFCQAEGYTYGLCQTGVSVCSASGGTNIPQGNQYCRNEAQGATCCCKN